ncbi:MAG: hypothetical protein H7Y20_05365 [Bryobacteraceae bacterium]|nr:hypothetical protein [Bryobacteraceae bacterium]
MTAEQGQPVETYASLAGLIDIHLLDPMLSSDQLYEECSFARENEVRAVVLRPCDLELAAPWFRSSHVILAVAVGHPDGTSTTAAKLYEGRELLRLGAQEIEFVLNPARLISRQFQHVEAEMLQISRSCHESGARLTAVFNSTRLTDDLRIIATKICRRVEADVISVDGVEADSRLLPPLLKDNPPRLKLARFAGSLDDALSARESGYVSFATQTPATILSAWRESLASKARVPVQLT